MFLNVNNTQYCFLNIMLFILVIESWKLFLKKIAKQCHVDDSFIAHTPKYTSHMCIHFCKLTRSVISMIYEIV